MFAYDTAHIVGSLLLTIAGTSKVWRVWKGYFDCNFTNSYCICNRSVTENLQYFVPVFLSHDNSWTHLAFDVPQVKIEL